MCIGLRTRCFREAEHCAALPDDVFGAALRRARENMTEVVDLNTLLQDALREFLDRDLERRMERPTGTPVYGHWWELGDPGAAGDADLCAIRNAQESLRRDLAENSPKEMVEYAERARRPPRPAATPECTRREHDRARAAGQPLPGTVPGISPSLDAQSQIREQVLRLASRFDDAYWLDRERTANFPDAF